MVGVRRSIARLVTMAMVGGLTIIASASVSAGAILKWNRGTSVDRASLVGLACPTSSLCVAIDSAGHLVVSRKPSGGPREWKVVSPSPRAVGLTGIACPTQHLCVAVDSAGDVIVSRSPLSRHSWSVIHVDSNPNYSGGPVLTGVSCPTRSLCVAVDYDGNAVISTDPAGGALAWTAHQIDNGTDYECYHYGGTGPACTPGLVAISCATATSCVAIDWAGGILSTDDPATGGAWGGGQQPASESYDALACPSGHVCLLGQLYSDQLWTQHANRSLTATTLGQGGAVGGIWCQSTRMCFATIDGPTSATRFFESRNPTAARPLWKPVHVDHSISAVSCPTQKLCYAAAGDGRLLVGTQRSRRG